MAKFRFFTLILISLFISSCLKDDNINLDPPTLLFSFQAKVNGENLTHVSKMYTNSSLDSFSITKFNYYISNIKLIREDGFVYTEPESYHLNEHMKDKTTFSIANLPEGNYVKVEFLIGVDSLRNVSGARSGALDPANDMFWDWAQGYIFFKMEGAFSTLKRPDRDEYAIHIGGFKGFNSCLQNCAFNLNTPITAKKGRQCAIFYNVLIDEVFFKPTTIGFDYYYNNINNKTFKAISDNYSDMFVVEKINN